MGKRAGHKIRKWGKFAEICKKLKIEKEKKMVNLVKLLNLTKN